MWGRVEQSRVLSDVSANASWSSQFLTSFVSRVRSGCSRHVSVGADCVIWQAGGARGPVWIPLSEVAGQVEVVEWGHGEVVVPGPVGGRRCGRQHRAWQGYR